MEQLRQNLLLRLDDNERDRKRRKTDDNTPNRTTLVAWAKTNGTQYGLKGNSRSQDILNAMLTHTNKTTPPKPNSTSQSITIPNQSIPNHKPLNRFQLTSIASYELQDEHFYKGVSFSPDGRCVLTTSDDRKLRLFEVPSFAATSSSSITSTSSSTSSSPMYKSTIMQPVLTFSESETIYDTAWYPHMTSESPQTCVFASTSRNSPIHLFDAYTGAIRASYRAYDHYDELAAALSVSFNIQGTRLYAGFPRMIRIFDVGRPGKHIEERPTCSKRRGADGQKGLISCIDFNPDCSGLYAVGSYSGSMWIYDDRSGEAALSFERAHHAGVTQIKWDPKTGQTLFSGGRRDEEIVMWDIRGGTNGALRRFKRDASTNQRFTFDLSEDGDFLVTGSSKRGVKFYNLQNEGDEKKDGNGNDKEEEEDKEKFPDAVNGVALGKSHAKGLLVTCTGERKQQYGAVSDDSSTVMMMIRRIQRK